MLNYLSNEVVNILLILDECQKKLLTCGTRLYSRIS